MTNRRSKAYIPSVAKIQATCEGNYILMMRLMPQLEPVAGEFYYGVDEHIDIRLRILEVSRYTNLIEIEQLTEGMPPYLQSKLEVRCYHDARVAEVTKYQNVGRLKPRYDYPNTGMHQQDEKEMHNHFLREWLTFCLQNGHSKVPVIPA